jgi:hypothetical protein
VLMSLRRLPGANLLLRWLPVSDILLPILRSLAGAPVLMCLLPVSNKTFAALLIRPATWFIGLLPPNRST